MTPNPNPSPELLPCPFCGGEPFDPRPFGTVECRECGACTSTDNWNTRDLSPQTLPAPGEVEANLEAQRQAIEACARVAERMNDGLSTTHTKIATAIRALRPNLSLASERATLQQGRDVMVENPMHEAEPLDWPGGEVQKAAYYLGWDHGVAHQQRAAADAWVIPLLREALLPFANLCDQLGENESDEEWAKFRLLIGDYRRARSALRATTLEKRAALSPQAIYAADADRVVEPSLAKAAAIRLLSQGGGK